MNVTFQLPDRLAKKLIALPDREEFVTSTLERCIAERDKLEAWQREEIKQGLAEAKSGDFADDEEIKVAFSKFVQE